MGVISIQQPQSWVVSKFAFKKRFPSEKWKAAKAASKVDADLEDFFEDIAFAREIVLNDPRTSTPVASLAGAGVPAEFRLTQDEVMAVIGVPCQPGEEP